MGNKILKRALERPQMVPEAQLLELVHKQIAEADLFQALLDGEKDGHLVLDGNKTVFINASFSSLIPCNRGILVDCEGKNVREVVTDRQVLDYVLAADRAQSDRNTEFYFQFGEEIRTVSLSYHQVGTEEYVYRDFLARDITEEKRNETKLRRTESLASMTTMAAGIAHEIKNPLAAMQIHLQLLRRAYKKKSSLTEEEAERYLAVLDEEISHLNGIAVDFLFAVRPMNIVLALGDVNPVCEDLVAFVRPELKMHGITVVTRLQKFLPNVELDANYLRQALLNIVKNAMNAMEKGGRLTISTKLAGDFIELRLSDTGCGISEEHVAKIFEPYFTTKASGTGLGLTVVYKVIKEHKGDISVTSQVGKGTTFIIKLPVPQSERLTLEHKEAD